MALDYIDRRRLLFGFAANIAASTIPARALDATPKSMAEWMDAWMTNVEMREVEDGLYVGRFKDPMYFLTKPIAWTPNPDQLAKYKRVEAPKGFVTDFASIPRAFWSLLRPDGDYAFAAVIHDYLYWFQPTTREAADNILLFAMRDLGIAAPTATTIYEAVRQFGSSPWEENKKLKESGEKRLIAKFPNDPRLTWLDWKKSPGVFAD